MRFENALSGKNIFLENLQNVLFILVDMKSEETKQIALSNRTFIIPRPMGVTLSFLTFTTNFFFHYRKL